MRLKRRLSLLKARKVLDNRPSKQLKMTCLFTKIKF